MIDRVRPTPTPEVKAQPEKTDYVDHSRVVECKYCGHGYHMPCSNDEMSKQCANIKLTPKTETTNAHVRGKQTVKNNRGHAAKGRRR